MKQLISSWDNPTSATRNEIVFANRNQLYGAYVLRQRYEKSLAKAFAFTCSLCVLLLLIPYLSKLFSERETVKTVEGIGCIFDFQPLTEKPEVLPELPRQKAASAPTYSFRVPQVIDDIVNDKPPVQDPNNNLNPGLNNHPADSGAVFDDTFPVDTTTVIEKPHEMTDVQEIPMFPGGNSAMMNYLITRIRYPYDAKNANIHGTVYLSFVIDKEGVIKDASIMRGIGGGCDEEALRVVKSMPAWTPGKQNGRAVMVRLVLPVQFSLK